MYYICGMISKTMERYDIMEHIETLQRKVDAMGFKGQNEYDLHLREEIADWVLSLKNNIKCSCPNEIKTGTVAIHCCNICGKPDEDWWGNK